MTFKVGDRVTLTGEDWVLVEPDLKLGEVHTILNVDEDGALEFVATEGDYWDVSHPGWEVELNTDTPSEHFAKLEASSFEQSVRRHTDKIADLLIAKNKAYGDSALNPVRIFSKASRIEQLNVRIDDKISRIQRGTDFGDEDTVRDLIGYLVLRLIAEESE